MSGGNGARVCLRWRRRIGVKERGSDWGGERREGVKERGSDRWRDGQTERGGKEARVKETGGRVRSESRIWGLWEVLWLSRVLTACANS